MHWIARISLCFLSLGLGLFGDAGWCADAIGQMPHAYPTPKEGTYLAHNFHFVLGETLPDLKLHYRTLGTPRRNAQGEVTNAVLIMHGTGGTGAQFLSPVFADVLFGPGQPLDATRYYIILPDAIGGGGSSKPSDGLHAHFPHYTYTDMVVGQRLMLVEGLQVNHLRLAMGTSMGCMHSFMWGEMYPGFADALMPLGCNTVEIAGRNRMMRKMIMDAITTDPTWNQGEYTRPVAGMRHVEDILLIMGSAPLQMQKQYPTRLESEGFLAKYEERGMSVDANDTLYQFDSSRDYDPHAKLNMIRVPVMYINSADDFVNPPELGIAERNIRLIPKGKFVLLPITDETRGHGTHTLAAIWQKYLVQLLAESESVQ
jgi:homoserine O-acetyltransferase